MGFGSFFGWDGLSGFGGWVGLGSDGTFYWYHLLTLCAFEYKVFLEYSLVFLLSG